MASPILYRFRNDVFGGAHDITLTENDMPNFFPIGEDVRQNSHIADTGKLWQYTWFRRETYSMQFESVGTLISGSFGSMIRENYNILWYRDINAGAAGATGTISHTGGWKYTPFAPNLVNFSLDVREVK